MATHIHNEMRWLSNCCKETDTGTLKGTPSRDNMEPVSQPPSEACKLIPLFLGKRSRNVSFVLDTTEDMQTVLSSVKCLLVQTLLIKASLRDSLFNVIGFSYKVTRWSDHMLPCAPDTVYKALPWIRSLSCSPGRDLLSALRVALSDPACHAIHLVTKGLPDYPEVLLQTLPTIMGGRPIIMFFLSDPCSPLDRETQDFLQCLTLATRGSCYVIPVGAEGVLEQVIPLYTTKSQSSVPMMTIKPLQPAPYPPLWYAAGNPFCPISSCVLLSGRALGTADFLPGCRVLARKELDSFYYLGTVKQQVQSQRGVYVVDFDGTGCPDGVHGYISGSNQQLVCSLDMLNHTQAHTHLLVPNDVVLTPWETDLKRYGPGRVLSGTEERGVLKESCGTGLQVLMWDGSVTQVPGNLAVWIPTSHHERIVRELKRLPALECCHGELLCVPSTSFVTPALCCTQCYPQCALCHGPITQQWPMTTLPRHVCSLRERLERAELESKVDLQLKELQNTKETVPEVSSSSSSSSASEDEEVESPNIMLPSSSKMEHDQSRPPWKYWRRSPPEPQHRQPRRTNSQGRNLGKAPNSSIIKNSDSQLSALANNSSLFQPLPNFERKRVTIRDVIGQTNTGPHRPMEVKSVCISNHLVTAIYT